MTLRSTPILSLANGQSGLMRVFVRTGLGLSFVLGTIPQFGDLLRNKTDPNHYETAKHDQKRCSMCGHLKPTNDYYRKGARTDSRCRHCVLGIKRRTRQQTTWARKKKPRGRVIEISSVSLAVIPAQIGSPVLKEWVEFTIGD